MVGYAPTMVVTGNGESGSDSGEGASELAKVVVVKKLVVGSQFESVGPLASGY